MNMSDFDRWGDSGHEFETQRPRRLPPLIVAPPGRVASARIGAPAGAPSQALMDQFPEPTRSLIYAAQRKADFIPLFGTVGTEPILVRPAEARTYLIVQNTSAANQLFVGVGYQPTNNGTSVTGLILAANGGNFEPAAIPQGDIYLLGSAAGTGFVVYVANG